MKSKAKKWFGKIIAVSLVTCMLLGSGMTEISQFVGDSLYRSGIIVSAAETYGVFEFSAIDENSVSISKYTGSGGSVTIPDIIDGKKVSSIGSWAFAGCTSLYSVNIPKTVETIYSSVFSGCHNLSEVTIKNPNMKIGSGAFNCCYRLNKITLPPNITELSWGLFFGCSSLTEIVIPDQIKRIDNQTFQDCSSLKTIYIPKSVSAIYNCAFSGCTSLKDVYYGGTKEEWEKISIDNSNSSLNEASIHYLSPYVPETVQSGTMGQLKWKIDIQNTLTISGKGDMPDYVDKGSPFYGNTEIMQIIIEDGITGIGAYAFQGVGGLISISIPDSVTKINAHAFDGNNSMVYIVANGVTEIGEAAFKNCKNFSFDLPEGLKIIENEAFYGCETVIDAVIPNTVTSIGDYAFYKCSSMKHISIPDSVKSIGKNAFAKCNMQSVSWSAGTAVITEGAFEDCQNLMSVTIPYTVTKVEKNAFNGCQSLITVFYDGFEDEWNEIVIESGNDKLKSASVHWYEIGQTLDEELLEKTKLYTSDGGVVYKKVLESLTTKLSDDSISQEDKLAMINNFYQAFNVTSLRDGLEYTLDQTKGKNAFDYLTNNDAFLAYQFKWWLHNTAGGTMARGYMISEGWIYNNELKQYLNPKTYITGETVDIKNYKAMLLSFMQYKVDNGLADDAKKVVGYADKVRKYTEKIIGKMDESAKKNIQKDLDRFRIESYNMTQDEVREGMQKIWNKYKLTDTIENDKRVYHIEGFEELSKALKISGKTFKVVSTTLSDLLDIINVESKLETIEQYRKFLELVADGKDYLPGDLVIAANQLLQETVEPYQRQLTNYIYDAAVTSDGAFDVSKTLKKDIKESIKAKYPDLFKTDAAKFAATFGEAIAVIETSAVVVDALTKVGAVIKDASYVEAYAYLGQYFTILLRDKRDQFRANETIENAWEFYDMYHLLFRVRTCGENAYLKMCKESAVTNILAKVGFKWFDITDREQFVKDTFNYMNNYCFFGLDNADEIPEAHKFAQKAVIKCPVDVEILDSNGRIVYTIIDGNEQDITNNIGRFICRYDPKLGDYIKIIYLQDDKSYTIKALGNDFGNVGVETSGITSDNKVYTSKITGLPIEETGIITINMKTLEYEDDIKGDSKQVIKGKMEQTTEESIIDIISLSLTDKSIQLQEGDKKSVGVVINPVNATYSDVIWNSSDNAVATVSAGSITAISEGTTVITAETYDGKFKATCTVVVRPEGIIGDTNGDGTADIADALMISRYDAGLITMNSTQIAVSDVNGDGNADIADALKIARFDAGLIEKLG